MKANDVQVGGTHYRRKYQHWDFVCDTGMHYLLGCATKYVSRWESKNGIQDLNKSIHYLQKAKERGIIMDGLDRYTKIAIHTFANQFGSFESSVIIKICNNDFDVAISDINKVVLDRIKETEYVRG